MSYTISNRKFHIDLVVPVFNEANMISAFYSEVNEKLSAEEFGFTIIFINDGSGDTSQAEIEQLSSADSNVKYIQFSRNFGKETAIAAGLDASTSECAVILDVDLQDPLECIPQMIDKWKIGADVVIGVRNSRREDSLGKKVTANIFYKLFNRLTDEVKLPKGSGDFRLIDAEVVQALRGFGETSRFMKGIFAWVGYQTDYVFYERPQRALGKTSFNYRKLAKLALNGILSFSTKPLRIWLYLGFTSLIVALVVGFRIFTQNVISGTTPPGLVSTLFIVTLMGGVQLLGIGLLGEYLGKVFIETKRRPLYIVKKSNSLVQNGNRGDRFNPPI